MATILTGPTYSELKDAPMSSFIRCSRRIGGVYTGTVRARQALSGYAPYDTGWRYSLTDDPINGDVDTTLATALSYLWITASLATLDYRNVSRRFLTKTESYAVTFPNGATSWVRTTTIRPETADPESITLYINGDLVYSYTLTSAGVETTTGTQTDLATWISNEWAAHQPSSGGTFTELGEGDRAWTVTDTTQTFTGTLFNTWEPDGEPVEDWNVTNEIVIEYGAEQSLADYKLLGEYLVEQGVRYGDDNSWSAVNVNWAPPSDGVALSITYNDFSTTDIWDDYVGTWFDDEDDMVSCYLAMATIESAGAIFIAKSNRLLTAGEYDLTTRTETAPAANTAPPGDPDNGSNESVAGEDVDSFILSAEQRRRYPIPETLLSLELTKTL